MVLWIVDEVAAVDAVVDRTLVLVVVAGAVVERAVVVVVTAVTAVVGAAVGAWFGAQATSASNAATGKRRIGYNLRCLS